MPPLGLPSVAKSVTEAKSCSCKICDSRPSTFVRRKFHPNFTSWLPKSLSALADSDVYFSLRFEAVTGLPNEGLGRSPKIRQVASVQLLLYGTNNVPAPALGCVGRLSEGSPRYAPRSVTTHGLLCSPNNIVSANPSSRWRAPESFRVDGKLVAAESGENSLTT